MTKIPARLSPSRAGDVVAVAYVGASGRTQLNRRTRVDDNRGLSAVDLLELNRDLQGSRAIRLLATTNLGLYATLMERHLSDGVVHETELVVRLDTTSKPSTTPSPVSL